MISLPDKVSSAYNSFMAQKGRPASQQPYFRKWLRYYVDFCRKYRHGYDEKSSLTIALYPEMLERREIRVQTKGACRLVGLSMSQLQARTFCQPSAGSQL